MIPAQNIVAWGAVGQDCGDEGEVWDYLTNRSQTTIHPTIRNVHLPVCLATIWRLSRGVCSPQKSHRAFAA